MKKINYYLTLCFALVGFGLFAQGKKVIGYFPSYRATTNVSAQCEKLTDIIFSLPLKNGSDSLDICNRELDPEFKRDRFLNRFKGAYQSAPYFKNTFPLIEEIIYKEDTNLFGLLHYF